MDQKTGVILETLKVFESCFVKGISMIGVMNMGRRASALFHSPRGNKKKKSKDTGRPKFKQDFIKFTGNNNDLNAHCCITIPLFLANPERPNIASYVLIIFSFLFVISTLPLSLIFCVKVGNNRNLILQVLFTQLCRRSSRNMKEPSSSDWED